MKTGSKLICYTVAIQTNGDLPIATGERIRRFRKRLGMTQRYLGQLLGFPASSADVRMAQYESEDRNPKADLTRPFSASLLTPSRCRISIPTSASCTRFSR